MFPQRDFQDDFPEDSSCEGFNRQVSLLHRSISSASPGDSLPRTSFFSNYCLTAPAGSTFTDCEEVGEQCFVFFLWLQLCRVNDRQLASISLLPARATI